MKLNAQGIKDNAQHIAGIVIGKLTGRVYTKADRGARWYSTVAASLAAQGKPVKLLPYKIII